MEIDEIRVIVCEGQNLKGKKKDHCRASVIFGIGNDKFRTTIVDEPSGNVSWNEEQTFDTRNHLVKPVVKSVTNSPSPQPSQQHHSKFSYKPLIFTVKDKERVIGRVTQTLDKLSTTRKKFRCPLISPESTHDSELGHPGAAIPYLVYECWITKYRASPGPTSKNRSESELSLRNSVGSTELERIKSKTSSLTRGDPPDFGGTAGHRRQISSSSSNASSTLPRSRRGAATGKTALISSVKSFFGAPANGSFKEDRHSPSLIEGSNPFEPSLQNSSTNDSLSNACQGAAQTTENDINTAGGCGGPMITGLSPMQGPTTGGTRVVVRGQNLGQNGEDIVGIYVCGVDCSASLKYYSPSKIALTTPNDCPAGSGEILIVTRSGGASRCTVKYRFYRPDHENEQAEEEEEVNGHGSDLLMPQSSDTSLLTSANTRDGASSNYCYGGLYYLDLLKRQRDSNGSPMCNNINLDKIMLPTIPHRDGSTEASQHRNTISDMNNSTELSSRSAPQHFRRFKTTDLTTYENCSRESLLKEIYSLRRHVEDLTMENKLMRYYVDTLVLRVMEVCPEHLEKSQYKSAK